MLGRQRLLHTRISSTVDYTLHSDHKEARNHRLEWHTQLLKSQSHSCICHLNRFHGQSKRDPHTSASKSNHHHPSLCCKRKCLDRHRCHVHCSTQLSSSPLQEILRSRGKSLQCNHHCASTRLDRTSRKPVHYSQHCTGTHHCFYNSHCHCNRLDTPSGGSLEELNLRGMVESAVVL